MKQLASLALTASSCAAMLAGLASSEWVRVPLVGLGAIGAVIGLAFARLTLSSILRTAQSGLHLLADVIGAAALMAEDFGETFRARLAQQRAYRIGD